MLRKSEQRPIQGAITANPAPTPFCAALRTRDYLGIYQVHDTSQQVSLFIFCRPLR